MLGHLLPQAAHIAQTSYSSPITGIIECAQQGFSSTTYIVTFADDKSIILQLRKPDRPLPLANLAEAAELLGPLVPSARLLTHDEQDEEGGGLLAYEMTHIPGMTLGAFVSHVTNYVDLLPVVADGLGSLLAKCTRTESGQHADIKSTILKGLRGAVESTDPLLGPYKRDIANLIAELDYIEALPTVISNGDFSYTNIMVAEDGCVTGIVDWEYIEEVPFGFDAISIHWLRGKLVGKEYVCHPNCDEIERRFWTALFANIQIEITAQFIKHVETSMRVATAYMYTIGGKCNYTWRINQLRMELDYSIPWPVAGI